MIGAEDDPSLTSIALLVLLLAGRGWGYDRYGYVGFSPAAIILIVLVILLLTGNLNFDF